MTAIAEVLSPADYARLVAVADESAPWPPVQCPEWCVGCHSAADDNDDRSCLEDDGEGVRLSVESVGHGYYSDEVAEVRLVLHRRQHAGRDMVVDCVIESGGRIQTALHVTADEARRIAALLIEMAGDEEAAS